ncbi:MAG: glycine C-acetyltransferase [Spirochaetales bacterium]|nr:glycine C-acetyltransferase [Spirochaetales bacterium]
MSQSLLKFYDDESNLLKEKGFYKEERIISSPQQAEIEVEGGRKVLNFCANNYLGLADDPRLIESAKEGLDEFGYGLSSVRFICGTQTVHKKLENAISGFLGTEDTILYSSCFDANGGLFETILGEEDAVISDALNHASIIDGIRLCKAQRFRYSNSNMEELEDCLKKSSSCRFRLIATDGVFSMDGTIANLKGICDLAERYDALVMVDDSHAVGFIGETGAGTPEYCGVSGRVDIITGTLGKALGGASGGYTSGRKEIIGWLRQRSRPYLFSNSLAPVMAYTAIITIELVKNADELRAALRANTDLFRNGLKKAGFTLVDGEHPIVPLMLFEAPLAVKMADMLLEKGVYAIGFCYPVVPEGQARIRFQMSAAHSRQQIETALSVIIDCGKELRVI